MGAVEGGGNEIAPVIFVSPGEQMPFEGAVVDEISLGIHERAHFAALENPAHFQNVRQIAVIFAVSVDFSALLDGLRERDGLAHRLCGQIFAQDMNAALQRPDDIGRVFVGEIGDDDRIDAAA